MTTKITDQGAEGIGRQGRGVVSAERGIYAAGVSGLGGGLGTKTPSAMRKSQRPEGRAPDSPNGADSCQPRAERSAAQGWTGRGNVALKGRSTGGVVRGDGSPLQGFGFSQIRTQGDALGWNVIAPLGLNRNEGRAGADRGVHAAGACGREGALAMTAPPTGRTLKRPEGRAPVGRALRWLLLAFILHHSSFILSAYPPAPHHLFYGMVRDEFGSPIAAGAEVILETLGGVQIKTTVVPNLEPGVNYRLAVPMDAGITADLYKPTALRPTVPFLVRVRIGTVNYLPIEMIGDMSRMGQPGQRTLLNLTLGEDTDGDGLPDAWERLLNTDLTKVKPGEDTDRDGLTNLQEYLAGTYAFDPKDGFTLNIVRMNGERPVLEFTAIRGRTYTLQGSPDLKTWTTQSFRIPAEGADAPTRGSYPAADVRKLQVESIAAEGQPVPRFFRLMTQ